MCQSNIFCFISQLLLANFQADFEKYYSECRPDKCPNPEGCGSSKFSCLSEGSVGSPVNCRDYQEVKIQEQVQKLSVGKLYYIIVIEYSTYM